MSIHYTYLYSLNVVDEIAPLFFFKDFIYLFMRDTEREREREAETQAEGEAGSMQGALMWDWIPGLQDHAPGQRQVPNH